MPGRIRWEDLDRAGRAKAAQANTDREERPAPARPRSAPQPRPDMFCLTCGLHTESEAAAERHAADARHYRYTDLALGL